MASPPASQVRVAVRLRPLTSRESSEGGRDVVSADAFDRTVSLSRRRFTYDSVFPGGVTQSELYEALAPPLLEKFLGGYNATVLAYGQTGSGKTYTVGSEAGGGEGLGGAGAASGSHGEGGGDGLSDGDGLIPRFMVDIFAMLARRKEASQTAALQATDGSQGPSDGGDALIDFSLSASFLEVYGEDIHDLLDEGRASLPLREDASGAVIVKGLRDSPIRSAAEALAVLDAGTMNRTTASTLMNRTSSRSHAVFTVHLRQVTRGRGVGVGVGVGGAAEAEGGGGADVASVSRFTFVDLAGSERLKKTGAEGARAREGIRINEGLLALGNVINALADEGRLARGERVHVPYRQSKLTRLLQDALGGNSQTLFVACASPSDTNAGETLSTLQYAHRARNIRNAPIRNVDATAVELARLRSLAHLLQRELIRARFGGGATSVATDPEVERNQRATGDPKDIGEVNEALLKRDDVVAYLKQISEKASESSGGGSASNLNMSFPTGAGGASNMAMSSPTRSLPSVAAASRLSVLPASLSVENTSGRKPVQFSPKKVAPSYDGDDDAMILDVNPEEDIQIIDQLLELQKQDQQFQEGQKDDQDRLDVMEGEIVAQEGHLLELREHLKVYHNMKEKYERLMCEVHSLENEKQALAEELEKAQVDPTKGCSQAIKRKLQKVEEGLARARSETRRHRQMYRQAEVEAQKCKVLERKILDLKNNKVSLIRKQREDAAKHKEFTNQKTREIQALKRREKQADRKISKMEAECQKFKANLERSRTHNNKLSDKLKQTESHLMRLLSKRRNDLNRRKSVHQPRGRGADDARMVQRLEGMDQFAPVNEEVKSIKFILEKSIADRVALFMSKNVYESKVVEHGKLMQTMAKEAKLIHERRRGYQAADPDSAREIAAQIREHEDNLQELQLQIELLENDLEQIRAKCPSIEDSLFEEDAKDENGPALKMITELDGPVLRTLLWNLLDSYVSAEVQRRTLKDTLGRKESTLKSFLSEIQTCNDKIAALTKSLDRRRKLVTSEDGQEFDPFDRIEDLEKEIQTKNATLESCDLERTKLLDKLVDLKGALSLTQTKHAQAEERLALFHSQHKLNEPTEETEQRLRQLQDVLAIIGMSAEDRELETRKLELCVENAVNNALSEAMKLRDEKMQEVNSLRDRLDEMHSALGHATPLQAKAPRNSLGSLTSQFESLDQQLKVIQPQYNIAVERCNWLVNDVKTLSSDLCLTESNLSDNLQKFMQSRKHRADRKRPSQVLQSHRMSLNLQASRDARAKLFKNVEHMMKGLTTINEMAGFSTDDTGDDIDSFSFHADSPLQHVGAEGKAPTEPGSLATSFLDDCERDIKRLRLMKSDRLLQNIEKCKRISSITKKMHVSSGELSSIVLHGMKKQKDGIPKWWDRDIARLVYDALSKKNTADTFAARPLVNVAFTNHLSVVLDTVEAISRGRQLLSDSLKTVLNESHSALIATAKGCGMDVGDVSQSLHDALFHLPPLSKEHVKACIDEMEMLVSAAETVSQSEIETLTVLWEGLNLSSSDRGQFWGELDQLTSQIEMKTESPFDIVLDECPAEVEEWVLKSSKDSTRVQRMLGIRVFKLNKIHEEVERLKRKQDAKNGIMSLNNELKLLSAKLADFEDKAGNKQRLLNKKVNSSSLLEEERFRKQMQGMFGTKLETLRQMLDEWEKNEGCIKDDEMLSEVVKGMQLNSHRIEAWMEEKTRLMHLKTTNIQSKHRPSLTPPGRANGSMRPLSGSRSRASAVSNQSDTLRKQKSHISKFSGVTGQRSVCSAISADAGQRPRRPKSTAPPKKDVSIPSEQQKRKALSSSTHNAPQPDKAKKHASSVETNENVAPVLLPFGNLLADTPKDKENESQSSEFFSASME